MGFACPRYLTFPVSFSCFPNIISFSTIDHPFEVDPFRAPLLDPPSESSFPSSLSFCFLVCSCFFCLLSPLPASLSSIPSLRAFSPPLVLYIFLSLLPHLVPLLPRIFWCLSLLFVRPLLLLFPVSLVAVCLLLLPASKSLSISSRFFALSACELLIFYCVWNSSHPSFLYFLFLFHEGASV